MNDLDVLARRELKRAHARERAIRHGRGRPEMLMLNHLAGFGVGGAQDADPYWANVIALLHFDGADGSTTFTDVKGHTVTLAGSAQIDTAQSKFSGASALFNGTTDYASIDHADFDLGTGDYCVECFAYWSAISGDKGVFQVSSTLLPGTYADLAVFVGGTDAIALYTNAGYTYSASSAIGTGAFYHIAAVRNGANVDLYVNGTSVVTRTASTLAGRQVLTIGGAYSSSFLHNGWIDELRVTKGVPRYTSAFTPPGLAFPEF